LRVICKSIKKSIQNGNIIPNFWHILATFGIRILDTAPRRIQIFLKRYFSSRHYLQLKKLVIAGKVKDTWKPNVLLRNNTKGTGNTKSTLLLAVENESVQLL
jgi:hypothetical protein